MSGDGQFSDAERAAVYRAIFERRDVRRNFLPTPIPDAVLTRVLTAAHHAGSVGFMQPWDFVVVRDPATKGAVKELFQQANAEAATTLSRGAIRALPEPQAGGDRRSAGQYRCDMQPSARRPSRAGPFDGARYGFV